MLNWRSLKSYTEEDIESILNRLGIMAGLLNVTSEELVVRAFTEDGKQVPQKTNDCFTIAELESSWPRISGGHVCDCVFCQELIQAAFPGLLVRADADLVNEIEKVKTRFVGKCPSCRPTAVQFGKQKFFPIPLRNKLSHVQQCLFCQLLIHYHRDGKNRNFFSFSCLDMDGWRVYPLFHPKNLHHITKHCIKECRCVSEDEKCHGRAVLRFRFNALRDRPQFQQLKSQLAIQLKWHFFINRFIKKPLGDAMTSYRFHCDMFTKKHPWSIWKSEDGLLRLLTADNLSFEECLYKELLENPEREQEIVGRLIATFRDYKPWDWTYKLPDRPLLWNRATVIEFLRLESESRQQGISVEELKTREAEEERRITNEIDEEIQAKQEQRERARGCSL